MSCGPTYSAKVANSLNLRRVGEEAGEKMKALHEPGEQIDECFAVFRIGELRLKARPQGVDLKLHLRIRPGLDQLEQIGGVLLREDPCGQNFRVQFRAEVLIRFFRLERRSFPILREGFEDLLWRCW